MTDVKNSLKVHRLFFIVDRDPSITVNRVVKLPNLLWIFVLQTRRGGEQTLGLGGEGDSPLLSLIHRVQNRIKTHARKMGF